MPGYLPPPCQWPPDEPLPSSGCSDLADYRIRIPVTLSRPQRRHDGGSRGHQLDYLYVRHPGHTKYCLRRTPQLKAMSIQGVWSCRPGADRIDTCHASCSRSRKVPANYVEEGVTGTTHLPTSRQPVRLNVQKITFNVERRLGSPRPGLHHPPHVQDDTRALNS